MKLRKLYWIALSALLAGTLTVISCGDSPTNGGDSDPNVFCDENLCAANDELKNQCINTFNTCIATNADVNDDECVAAALLICKE